jgi:hypothetical protein
MWVTTACYRDSFFYFAFLLNGILIGLPVILIYVCWFSLVFPGEHGGWWVI